MTVSDFDGLIAVTNTHVPDAWTAGTDNSSAVDLQSAYSVAVVVNAGTLGASATVDVHVEDSADGSTGWADVTGAAFTQITEANDNATYVGRINPTGVKRYIRVVLVVATATSDVATSVVVMPKYSANADAMAFTV